MSKSMSMRTCVLLCVAGLQVQVAFWSPVGLAFTTLRFSNRVRWVINPTVTHVTLTR